MHNAPLTPPTTPPLHQHLPASPESRLGKVLGQSLRLLSILGTGAYGVVYKAVDEWTGTPYAVKALSKTNQNGEPLDRRQREFQSREIQLHYAASAHPNIVSMLKIVDDSDCTYVILEYCQEGDLFSNITERCRYVNDDALVRRAFLQVLDAVEHCHRLGIYHRDLKPENVLVSNSGNDVLLADFGLATTDPESEDHGCGSTFYMSPECLDQSSRKPSYRCAPNDIWSLGVILVNLSCGRNPWKQASVEDSTYKAFTKDPSFLKTILPLSDDLNDILCRIFERNPEERITIRELKQRIISCVNFSTPAPMTPCSPRSCATSETGSLPELDGGDSGYMSLSNSEQQRQRTPSPTPSSCYSPPTPNSVSLDSGRPAPVTPFAQQYVLPSPDIYGNHWNKSAWTQAQQPMVHPYHPYHQYHQFGMQSASPYYPQGQCFTPAHLPIDNHFLQYSRDCW